MLIRRHVLAVLASGLLAAACSALPQYPPVGQCPSYGREGTVVVKVVDAQGQPVPNVRVGVARTVPSPSPMPTAARLSCVPAPMAPDTNTDAQGVARFDVYYTGLWAVRLIDTGAAESAVVDVKEGQTVDVTVVKGASPSPATPAP